MSVGRAPWPDGGLTTAPGALLLNEKSILGCRSEGWTSEAVVTAVDVEGATGAGGSGRSLTLNLADRNGRADQQKQGA